MPNERDIMLREMAQHRGFKLMKSRRRKPGGDFGLYGLTDAATGQDCYGIGRNGLEASFEEVESHLRGAANATWKRSLGAAGKLPRTSTAPQSNSTPEPIAAADPPERARRQSRSAPPPLPEQDSAPAQASERKRTKAKVPKAAAPPFKPDPEPLPLPRLIIRDAKAGDAEAIAALLGRAVGELAATLRQLIQSGQAPLVAEEDGIIGCAAWQVMPLLQQEAPLGRITLLHVAEQHRRRHVGRALLAGAEERLSERGCDLLEVLSGIDVDNAHGFFRRMGYDRTSYRFSRTASKGRSTNN